MKTDKGNYFRWHQIKEETLDLQEWKSISNAKHLDTYEELFFLVSYLKHVKLLKAEVTIVFGGIFSVCACARSARDCSMTWRAVRGAKQRDRRGRRAPALPVKWHDTTSKQTMHPRSCALQTAKIIRKRTANRRLNKSNRAKMQLNILNYNA